MFAYPNVKVTRINLMPLLPPGALERMNPQRVLKKIQREVFKQVQHQILQSTLSTRAKVALSKGFEVQRRTSSVVVIAKHPGFRPLLEGRKRRQMKWLVKATRPIPIVLDTGELIFRNATPRSMQNGSWYHPKRQATTVLQKASKAAREIIRARVKEDFKRQIAAGVRKGRR